MTSLIKLHKPLCQCQIRRQFHITVSTWRRKKPPARDMSKRNLQGVELEERLKRKQEDIDRQKPYKEALALVIQRFQLELDDIERKKHDTQGELMKREQAEREQAAKNLVIIAKSNKDLQQQRELENLIREDELQRAEEEKQRKIIVMKEEILERNRKLVLQAIEDSKDFVTQENLEDKINELLDARDYFNYAITPQGAKIHSTKPPSNLGDWKGASPTAYIMGGIKPGSSDWNFIFRGKEVAQEKESVKSEQ